MARSTGKPAATPPARSAARSAPAAKPAAPVPRASARARQVASPNARFNRGTAKPTTPARPRTRTIPPAAKGQKPITFKPGGLHASTGTPQGRPVPAAKKARALAGGYGPKAAKQARFAKNVLRGGRRK